MKKAISLSLLITTASGWAQSPSTMFPQTQRDSESYMFCYSNGAVPGTRNALVSTVYRTDQSPSKAADEFTRYATQHNYDVTFTCHAGDEASLRRESIQMITNIMDRGFNVAQVQRR